MFYPSWLENLAVMAMKGYSTLPQLSRIEVSRSDVVKYHNQTDLALQPSRATSLQDSFEFKTNHEKLSRLSVNNNFSEKKSMYTIKHV